MVKIRCILKDTPYFVLNEAFQKSAEGVKGRLCRFHGALMIVARSFVKHKPRIRARDGSRVCDPRRVWDGVPQSA